MEDLFYYKGLGSLEPFKGVIFWGRRSPSLAQLHLQASVVLENGSYQKEAHWSNHMLPTPHCGVSQCSRSAAHSTFSEPKPEPAPHVLTHNYNTHSCGDSHAIEHHGQNVLLSLRIWVTMFILVYAYPFDLEED